VLLGGGYAAVVLGLGQLLGRDSSLAVAASASKASSTAASTGAALWLRPQRPT
jgi:hypothetical protein